MDDNNNSSSINNNEDKIWDMPPSSNHNPSIEDPTQPYSQVPPPIPPPFLYQEPSYGIDTNPVHQQDVHFNIELDDNMHWDQEEQRARSDLLTYYYYAGYAAAKYDMILQHRKYLLSQNLTSNHNINNHNDNNNSNYRTDNNNF